MAPLLLVLEKTIFEKQKPRENFLEYLKISTTTIHSASLAFILYVMVSNFVPLHLKIQRLYLHENIHKTYDSSDILVLSETHLWVAPHQLQCGFYQCLSTAAIISFNESKGLICETPLQVFPYGQRTLQSYKWQSNDAKTYKGQTRHGKAHVAGRMLRI